MIKLFIAGDFCENERIHVLNNEGKYDEVFIDTSSIKKADLSIINLESPIVLNSTDKLKKPGPIFKSTVRTLDALKYAGFNIFTLANNHFYDYGDIGVNDTLNACKKNNVEYVGGGLNIVEAERVLYKEVNNKIIGIINFCENEFSIATETTGGANPLDIINNYNQIRKAKAIADYLILIIHGGHEHYQLPSPRMKKTYRFFVDAGADIVVNHHQHCYSGYEIYNKKPIFYGLGNYSFDWKGKRGLPWNEGFSLEVDLDNDNINFTLLPHVQGDDKPGVYPMDGNQRNDFFKKIDSINQLISSDRLLYDNFVKFCNSQKKLLLLPFEPYTNKLLRALRLRGLLPPFISSKRKSMIYNEINCESYLDILKQILK